MVSRRALLTAFGSALCVPAGCVRLPPGPDRDSPDSWPQVLHDGRNSNHHRGVPGPTDLRVATTVAANPPLLVDGGELVLRRGGRLSGVSLDGGVETIRAALPFVLGSPFLATDDRILLPYSTTSGELGVASLTRDLTAPDPVDWRTHALTVHPIPGPQGAPAVACGILVGFADLDSGYAAVSLREGRDRWEHETAPDAVRTRPAVADGRVFLVASHPEYWTLTALDARTGERDWQTERPFVDLDCQWPVSAAGGEALVDMPPIVDGERVYVFVNRDIPTIEEAGDVTAAEMPASDRVVAFDTTTGDQLWSADLGGIGAYGNMSLSDDSLFVTDVGWSADEEFWSEVTVVALDPATGDERWRTAPLSGLPYSLVSTRDHVYLASGNAVHVVERQTGEVRQRVEYGEVLSRLVVVENHVIAYAREKNEVVVFEGSAGESG